MSSGAEAETGVPSEHVLEWVQKDKRRFLHAVYCVGDLERTIKYVSYEILLWCSYLFGTYLLKLIHLFLTSQDVIPSALG